MTDARAATIETAALPADWPPGVGRQVLARCASTNAHAMAQAATLAGPAWIMAREQSAGRGRRGRGWAMPAGNFAATLLLPRPGDAAVAAQLSFVAALAADDALRRALGPASARTAIKWPNDLLLNGAKVAGILLESTGRSTTVEAVAVGIGMNLAAAPDASDLEPGAMPATSVLAETGLTITADDFLDLLAPAFARWLAQHRSLGFAPIRAAWLDRAARLGQDVTARTGTATLTGRFEGIDQTGALILTGAGGRQVIPAADIHFPVG